MCGVKGYMIFLGEFEKHLLHYFLDNIWMYLHAFLIVLGSLELRRSCSPISSTLGTSLGGRYIE